MTRCSVPFCCNNANHRFPKDPKLRNSWLKAIGRDDFVPKNGARICRKHFHRSDYVQIGQATGLALRRRCLKKSTIPSVFPLNSNIISSLNVAGEENRKRHKSCKRFDKTLVSSPVKYHSSKIKQVTQETQTLNFLGLFATTEQLLSDDESVLFYTGLDNYAQFRLLLSTLLPMANEIQYLSRQLNNLSAEDQFLMLLIKLRRSKPDFEIGKMFGVNKTDVSNVIVTWISFVTDYWSLLDSWPNQHILKAYMPETLRLNFTSKLVEIPITKEISRKVEKTSFSHYRLKKSLKFIAGCTPDELVFYSLEPQVASSTGALQIRDESPISGIMNADQELAKSIPMERLIDSTKMFKILANALNQIYAPLSQKIFSICLMICRVKVGIVTVC